VILVRPKPEPLPGREVRPGAHLVRAAMLGGTLATVGGLIFGVHQFEWLGVVLVLYACLRWALPARFSLDILLALFLVYWIHPYRGRFSGSSRCSCRLCRSRAPNGFCRLSTSECGRMATSCARVSRLLAFRSPAAACARGHGAAVHAGSVAALSLPLV